MIVTSVQIKTAKTQKHLYCLVFTKQYNPNLVPIGHGFGFIVFIEEVEDW